MDYDILIVGSGPAGTAAALGFCGSGLRIGMVDVGHDAAASHFKGGFSDALQNPAAQRDVFLGARHEYLESLTKEAPIPKLRAPLQRYVSRDPQLSPLKGEGFRTVISHAMGGLANVWGAQMLRYDSEDLRDFPLQARILNKHYDILSREIGLSGANDDLVRFYGADNDLQKPLTLNPNAQDMLRRYGNHKASLNKAGIYIGRPRTAILTAVKNGRVACAYDGMEFFRPRDPAIYTPAYTLQRLIAEGALSYQPGLLALRFSENMDGVTLQVLDIKTGEERAVTARKLFLAAGTLNSARIVMASRGHEGVRLPVMDNLLSYMPFINPWRLGRTRDPRTTYLQLNLCYKKKQSDMVMGSFYAVNGLFNSDFLTDLPLMMHDARRLLPHVLPAMLVLHLWHPAKPDTNKNYLSLDDNNVMRVSYTERLNGSIEKSLIMKLALLGFISLPSLVQYPLAGNSFHCCGTLPMRARPGRYETDVTGRLGESAHVHVIDGAVFPSLSAKNLSFTIMANAHRVARNLWGQS